jgi:hypothetical protein
MGSSPKPAWTLSPKCSATSAKGARWKLNSALVKMMCDCKTTLLMQSYNGILREEG